MNEQTIAIAVALYRSKPAKTESRAVHEQWLRCFRSISESFNFDAADRSEFASRCGYHALPLLGIK